MKWVVKIFVALFIFINANVAIGANKTLHKNVFTVATHTKQHITPSLLGSDFKLFPRLSFRRVNRLLATEYEEDTESDFGKKQTAKANPIDVYLTGHSIDKGCRSEINFRSKIPTPFLLNKVYLYLKVLKL